MRGPNRPVRCSSLPRVSRNPADLAPTTLEFLTERHLATLTTLRADGSPHVVPVGVTFDPATATARVITSTGADVAAAFSGAIGAMSGPLHGGAPARVLPMIEEVERTDDARGLVKGILDRGEKLVELLKPPVTVPAHFDDYDRFKSPLGDFVAEVGRRELPGELRTVQRGETVSLRA